MNVSKKLHVRCQPAKRGRLGWYGPDRYVAVTIAPENVKVPLYLNRKVLAKRGIEIVYFGEGYSRYTGDRSALGRAIRNAQEFVES